MKRLFYLDNLKVCLTVLVIFHHAGQAYGDGGGWAYQPSNPAEFMPWIWHFFSTNAAFFMGLYFLISGYFVPSSFDKQGTGHMWFVESLLFFCLLYAVIRQFCKPIVDLSSRPVIMGVLAVGILMGVGSYFIRQVSPQDHWVFFMGLIFEPAHYLQYIMMFFLGVLARRVGWLENMSNRTGVTALLIGIALAIGNYLRDGGS